MDVRNRDNCFLDSFFTPVDMVKLVYGSVCSGVEAASVAWEQEGFTPAWFSEISPFPCAVLKHQFPNVENLGDMTKIYEKETFRSNDIDLLVGGTPCQSFSVAGLRKGLADPRGNLTLEFLRIVDAKRPRWIVWENVPGVLSDKTNAFGNFIAGLSELGYGVGWRVLDAQYFGVPQRRKRVFVVGYLGDWRPPLAVLFERNGVLGHSPKSRETGEDITEATRARIDSSVDGITGAVTKKWSKGTGGPAGDECYNLVTYDTTQLTSNVNSQNRKPGDPCHTLAKNGDAPLLVSFAQNQCGEVRVSETIGTLNTNSNASGRNTPMIAFTDSSFGGYSEGVGTLRKNGGNNGGGSETLILNSKARRLTPVECERLQGFPDNWTNIPWKGGMATDGHRYQAMGNSMAVPVMRWLGHRIKMVDELINT